MKVSIQNIRAEAISQIVKASDVSELERLRIAYLGRRGKLNKLTKRLSELGDDEKKRAGILINQSKSVISEALAAQKNKLTEHAREWFDATIPGKKPKVGNLHLITQAISEISDIFKTIGFTRVRYPEAEWDWYSFEGLNFAKGHPARDDWETYWIDAPEHRQYGQMLLTPHTSSGQLREMQRIKLPPHKDA